MVKRCVVLDMALVRDAADWSLQGGQTLLQIECGVHQLHRLRSLIVKCRLDGWLLGSRRYALASTAAARACDQRLDWQ